MGPPPGFPGFGKPRSFGHCLALVIVTLGIYGWIWQWKVFREVDAAHGIKHHGNLFWAALIFVIGSALLPRYGLVNGPTSGVVGNVVLLIYLYKEISGLNEVRARQSLREGISAALFTLVSVLPILLGIGIMIWLGATRPYLFTGRFTASPELLRDLLRALGIMLLWATGVYAVVAVAYYRLQKSINQVWLQVYRAYGLPWPNVSPV